MQIPDSDEYNDTLVQFDVTALIYVRALSSTCCCILLTSPPFSHGCAIMTGKSHSHNTHTVILEVCTLLAAVLVQY